MKKYKLGDIAEIQISSVDKKSKDGEIPVKLCNFVDVYYNYAITKQMAKNFMNATAKQKEIDIFKLQKGQVALTKDSETRDDIGVPTYIADTFENVILGYHTALVTPNQEILNGKYLNAFLNTKYIQKYFENNATGSGQRYSLSNEVLANVPIIAPDLATQKKIGRLFSNIDKKIAINNQINAILESTARAIYEYYFVQFDFPNKQGKPYKSSGGAMRFDPTLNRPIPKDFEVCNLGDLCEMYQPQTLTIKQLVSSGKYFVYGANGIIGKHNEYNHTNSEIVIACRGNCNAINRTLPKSWIIGNAMVVKLKNNAIHNEYIYHTLKYLNIERSITGSVQKQITRTNLAPIKILSPNVDIILEYCSIIKSNVELRLKNELENQKLKNLRDFLLPLLINAQVRI